MVIARSPVRISFGGGGTDLETYYSRFGGFVLNAAITRYAYVVARRPERRAIRIISADYQLTETLACDDDVPVHEPLSLPKAAVERFARHGLHGHGVDLLLSADVPPGTGLGSSSAMSVSLLRALATYLDHELSREEAADLACWLEIERLQRPIGKQDQYASAYGGLNSMEFSADGVRVTPLDLPRPTVRDLEARLLLFSTGQSRNSADILGEQRHATQTQAVVVERLHRIKAIAYAMRDALQAGALDDFGRLLDVTWREKRGLSARVSSSAIDEWYAAAQDAGALGGKITGAGGGGFLLLYVPPSHQPQLRRTLTGLGLRELTFGFDFIGGRVMTGAETRRVKNPALRGLVPAPPPALAAERLVS